MSAKWLNVYYMIIFKPIFKPISVLFKVRFSNDLWCLWCVLLRCVCVRLIASSREYVSERPAGPRSQRLCLGVCLTVSWPHYQTSVWGHSSRGDQQGPSTPIHTRFSLYFSLYPTVTTLVYTVTPRMVPSRVHVWLRERVSFKVELKLVWMRRGSVLRLL